MSNAIEAWQALPQGRETCSTRMLERLTSWLRELCKLPGIGPKSADRLTHFLLSNGCDRALALASALQPVAERVRPCTSCFNLTEQGVCSICSDPRRDSTILCVVEQPRDLAALERSGSFRGQYHVLQGRLAPLENMGPEKLTLDALMRRIRDQRVQEVVLATNPTLEGDGTALYISSLIGNSSVRITRLARGLPSGSGLEFANSQMLADALEGRRAF